MVIIFYDHKIDVYYDAMSLKLSKESYELSFNNLVNDKISEGYAEDEAKQFAASAWLNMANDIKKTNAEFGRMGVWLSCYMFGLRDVSTNSKHNGDALTKKGKLIEIKTTAPKDEGKFRIGQIKESDKYLLILYLNPKTLTIQLYFVDVHNFKKTCSSYINDEGMSSNGYRQSGIRGSNFDPNLLDDYEHNYSDLLERLDNL